MNTLENAFLDALAADLRIAPEPTQQAVNPRTGKPYPTGVSLEPAMGAVAETVGAATTEDIKKFLDEAGLKAGTGESPAETVGEFAAPGGYIKGAKKAARAVKKATGAK